jgi:hypothetical protein
LGVGGHCGEKYGAQGYAKSSTFEVHVKFLLEVKREQLAVPMDAESRYFVSLFDQACNYLETGEICDVALLLVQFANSGA